MYLLLAQLRCCGINGPTDYRNQDAVPWSCCNISSLTNPSDDKGVCTSMYAHGCQHAVINHTRSILLYIFLLALCSVLVQVIISVNQLVTINKIGNVIILLFLGLLYNEHVMLYKSVSRKKKRPDDLRSIVRTSVQRFRNRRQSSKSTIKVF